MGEDGEGGRVKVICGSKTFEGDSKTTLDMLKKLWLVEWLCFELKRGLRHSAKKGVLLSLKLGWENTVKIWIEGYETYKCQHVCCPKINE